VSCYLLDTNIWIALAKGEAHAKEMFDRAGITNIVTCSVVRAELMYGARKSHQADRNLRGFRRLLEFCPSLPFDDLAADHYGELRATLEKTGSVIGGNDLMIASIALAHGVVLVTRDVREFERVAGLRLDGWL
jgi:tRNA(fMet)-specific endonuclease VapC